MWMISCHRAAWFLWRLLERYAPCKLWGFDDLSRPSPKYLQQTLRACPRLQRLSVHACLLYSPEGLHMLGSHCHDLSCLQIVEEALHPVEVHATAHILPASPAILTPFRQLVHGGSRVLTSLPGSPALSQLVADALSSPSLVTERGSPARTHAIMCHSIPHLRRQFRDGGIASCHVGGWDALPPGLQVLSIAAPTHTLPRPLQRETSRGEDITCWQVDRSRREVTEVRPVQLLCIKSGSPGGWACAMHPCQHVYDYPNERRH
ncbi:MAG: hypothetical protein WDW36_009862 [Sanguina aurantia]